MIDLQDLKLFLNLSQTRDKDTILLASIRQAISILEGLFNRELEFGEKTEFTELVNEGKRLQGFYLDCWPVSNVTSIQKYNYSTQEYDDLIAPEYIGSTILLKPDGEVVFLKPVCRQKISLKVKYKGGFRNLAGSGTVSTSSGSKIVTGSGTDLQIECSTGDEIRIDGIVRKVISIESPVSLTVSTRFDTDMSGKEFTISNVPEDLQQGIIYLAALNYLTSSNSRESLGLSSLSLDLRVLDDNSPGSIIDGNTVITPQRFTFKALDLKYLINKYRTINI